MKLSRMILVHLLKKERESLAHNIMNAEINQDNDLHDKYLKDRTIIQEAIEYLTDL